LHTSEDVAVAGLLLLDERDVPPGVRAEADGVVIGHAGQVQAVLGDVVPLLAGDLARLAADADRGIGEEAHPRRVVGVAVQAGGVALPGEQVNQAGHGSVPVSSVMPARTW
jgi:hypothetical protein